MISYIYREQRNTNFVVLGETQFHPDQLSYQGFEDEYNSQSEHIPSYFQVVIWIPIPISQYY